MTRQLFSKLVREAFDVFGFRVLVFEKERAVKGIREGLTSGDSSLEYYLTNVRKQQLFVAWSGILFFRSEIPCPQRKKPLIPTLNATSSESTLVLIRDCGSI